MRVPVSVAVITGLLGFATGTLVTALTARVPQQAAPIVTVGFMKVEPGKDAEYLRLERETWKPIHEARIRAGRMRSWTLYDVQYPYGTAHEYNYVTVETYSSLADQAVSIADIIRRVHPALREGELSARTQPARRLVRGEVWVPIDSVR